MTPVGCAVVSAASRIESRRPQRLFAAGSRADLCESRRRQRDAAAAAAALSLMRQQKRRVKTLCCHKHNKHVIGQPVTFVAPAHELGGERFAGWPASSSRRAGSSAANNCSCFQESEAPRARWPLELFGRESAGSGSGLGFEEKLNAVARLKTSRPEKTTTTTTTTIIIMTLLSRRRRIRRRAGAESGAHAPSVAAQE